MRRRRPYYLLLIFLLLTVIIFCNIYTPQRNKYMDYSLSKISSPIHAQPGVKYVYIILVDGLRYDSVLPNMRYLSGLIYSHKACLLKARFDGPSNSRPGYARIFTGASTSINGIWKNDQSGRCSIPSIFELARKSGLTTGASAYYWMGELYNNKILKDVIFSTPGENIQYGFFYGNENEKDSKIFTEAMEIINKYKPNLFLLHPMEVDIAGHKHGAVSTDYNKSVSNTDSLISGFVSMIDLKKSIVLIISDHGHKNSGGHGGSSAAEIEVPIIMIGSIIKGGIYDEVISQEDIAPTVCALLDIPFSPYMTGTVIDFPYNINKSHLVSFHMLNK